MRFAAQRYGTWEWLDLELPLDTDGPEYVLSSYGIMEGTIAPELGRATAEDGRLVLEEWGTLIHVEFGERDRRWTGIVVESKLQGKEWNVTVHEFPGYADGTPVESLVRGVKDDPADLIRQIWLDMQLMPNAYLGVTVVGSTGVTIGTDSDDKVAAARAVLDARQQTYNTLTKTKNTETKELQDMTATLADEVDIARKNLASAQATLTQLIKDNASSAQIEAARLAVVERKGTLADAQTAYTAETNAKKNTLKAAKTNKDAAQKAVDAARKAYDAAKDKAQEDGGAYEIRPEDTPDAHQSIKDLCDAASIEWKTSTKWTTGEPELKIEVAYPRIGSQRRDLVFEQGVNIISELDLVRARDYANAAIGVGAGEGSKAVRSSIANTTKRMRRVAVVEDKSLKKATQLTPIMRQELKTRSGEPYVASITVVDDPLAPIGSWSVGDDILVSGDVPHYGRYSKYHRIVSWQMKGETQAELTLELAENS